MDPDAAIVGCLVGDATSKREAHASLKGWYAAGGFRPTITDVAFMFWRQYGKGLTAKQIAVARQYGARGELAEEYARMSPDLRQSRR